MVISIQARRLARLTAPNGVTSSHAPRASIPAEALDHRAITSLPVPGSPCRNTVASATSSGGDCPAQHGCQRSHRRRRGV